jgi:hypothetical protein
VPAVVHDVLFDWVGRVVGLSVDTDPSALAGSLEHITAKEVS